MTKTARKTATATSELSPPKYAVSPRSGARIPLGAHPGNTGGKKGRSGRKPNELREAFRHLLEDGGLEFVQGVIRGEARVTLRGTCQKCGAVAEGPASMDEVLSTAPTVDNRLRAVDSAAKYGLGERSEYSEDVVAENVDRMLRVAETLLNDADFARFARLTDQIWNEAVGG